MTNEINKLIDHTILKADATRDEVLKICEEAINSDFMSVCINPTWVILAKETLKNTDVKVCTVIGFPLGANTSKVKAFETKEAIADGADEVDMVINIGAVKSEDWDLVFEDIKAVVDATNENVITKVIIEACLLTNEEIEKVSILTKEAGADFVKTSTGFSTGGAVLEDVQLIRKTVGPEMDIKASGGVRNYETVLKFVDAGATRIGTSNGNQIVEEWKK